MYQAEAVLLELQPDVQIPVARLQLLADGGGLALEKEGQADVLGGAVVGAGDDQVAQRHAAVQLAHPVFGVRRAELRLGDGLGQGDDIGGQGQGQDQKQQDLEKLTESVAGAGSVPAGSVFVFAHVGTSFCFAAARKSPPRCSQGAALSYPIRPPLVKSADLSAASA